MDGSLAEGRTMGDKIFLSVKLNRESREVAGETLRAGREVTRLYWFHDNNAGGFLHRCGPHLP